MLDAATAACIKQLLSSHSTYISVLEQKPLGLFLNLFSLRFLAPKTRMDKSLALA